MDNVQSDRVAIDVDGYSDDMMEDNDQHFESQSQSVGNSPQAQKRTRKLKSGVWKDFTILTQRKNQPLYCKCNRCGKQYAVASKNGTGNLKRHLAKCSKFTTKEIGQYMIATDNDILEARSSKFNQEKFRELVVSAVVRHDFPFSFVEYEGIRNIFKYLEPNVSFFTRNTANTPHTGISLAEKISGLVKSWGIGKKLFSITLDSASSNDVCVDVLKNQFRLMNSLVFDGKLFHLRCCAHILNLIVKDGLKQIDVVVEKVRDCVKYVKGSQRRKEAFVQCCSQNLINCSKALTQDVSTRWNSTYKMLSSALYYRLAFSHLSLSDLSFQSCPSMEEWERVEKVCDFLKLFYEATLAFSGSLYPTSNLFFPNIFEIHLKLVKELESEDDYMKKIANQLWAKSNKYWADFNLLLVVAVVFDPRYKFSFVEFSFSKLYGEGSSQTQVVKDTLFGLFNEHVESSKKSASSAPNGVSSVMNSRQVDEDIGKNILKEFDLYDAAVSLNSKPKCQLQEYLDEPRIKASSISILDYWKAQQYRYPDVAKLAMDILCVPVSTVASESALSLGGRILDKYRSSMLPSNVEALVCTRDWLFVDKESHDELEVNQNVMDFNIEKDESEATSKKT